MGVLNGNTPLAQLRQSDDGLPTDTSIAQRRVEDSVLETFTPYAPHNVYRKELDSVLLDRQQHIPYLQRGLKSLSRWMVSLDASRPWIAYWILHSLDLLDADISEDTIQKGIESCKTWQLPTGGFGGGPGQYAHLATTYAAVNTLAILGTKEAYDVIDRESLYSFLMRMKQPDGSFTMHVGGEIDIRGSYCALSAAALTNLLTPELTRGCADFIKRAQTYEGGIGPYPGKEAHNGYTFCGLAAMEILGEVNKLNVAKLTRWCADRQMSLEGGFQGRTNKLVDGCYSFWGAGDFPILYAELERQSHKGGIVPGKFDYVFDREALQEYILISCQSEHGGLIDKPKKGADYYHTCYCLSGLSTAQHLIRYNDVQVNGEPIQGGLRSLLWTSVNDLTLVGDLGNELMPTHPVHNITLRRARDMIHYFYGAEADALKDIIPKDEEPADLVEEESTSL